MTATIAPVAPVAGPLFRRIAKVQIHGTKRRKLVLLLAAYRDSDPTYRPPVRELAARLGLGTGIRAVKHVDYLLARLEQDGILVVHRTPHERNRYEIVPLGS
jgi:hypothetical protein